METSSSEDNVELETQLYGQIQHQPFLEQTEPSAACKEKRFQKVRYWTQGRPYRGKKKQKRKKKKNKNVNALVGLSYAKNSKSAKTEMNSKTELQPSSPMLKSDDIPETSEASNRNMMKPAKVLKYQFKKIEASQSKEKQKKYDIETIIIDSSDDSDVEISLPNPVTVTYCSQDNEFLERHR